MYNELSQVYCIKSEGKIHKYTKGYGYDISVQPQSAHEKTYPYIINSKVVIFLGSFNPLDNIVNCEFRIGVGRLDPSTITYIARQHPGKTI